MLTTAALGLLTAVHLVAPPPAMREVIETYQADYYNLTRFYNQDLSDTRATRMQAFFDAQAKRLSSVDFDSLDRDGQVDYILFQSRLEHERKRLEILKKENAEILPLLPFAPKIVKLFEDRQQMKAMESEKAAKTLKQIADEITDAKKKAENGMKVDRAIAYRAANVADDLDRTLKAWFKFYDGYDPLFSWWCRDPQKSAVTALEGYSKTIREKLVGTSDKDAIIGHPIGREALLEDLRAEMIPYTPEELLDIAAKEYAWCEAEMKKASREMGFGDDWRKALEKVKEDHVGPGEQTKLIRELADEAVKFTEDHHIVTVPDLAKETWRMEMMSPERQKVNPFFLGGDTIIVSFPTDEMSEEQKQMSMRANNRHFARATVFHELIPGHHLQGFMEERYHPYRQLFSTPFWTEGWALWMEFLFWDLGFPKTPENRIGMLFWRMHRCVRIEFSLGFHLGKYTPQQCIDMLVDKVGHERSTAEGEVRRSFGGDYSPLYQAAYMLGALQLRSLAKECVGKGKMSYQEFHDAVLKEGNIPISLVRAIVTNRKLSKNFKNDWRFAD